MEILILLLITSMSMHVCMWTCACECECLRRPGEDVRSSGVGVIGGCDLLNMGAER